MFCKIFTTGNDNYVYLNPNCNMKLIYEYLRVVADIPENFEIDLCSEDGLLLGIFDSECSKNGLLYLKPRANYYIFIFDYHEDKPDLYDPRPLMDYTDYDFNYVFGLIKKNFGIPKDEYIREDDAELIFEHMLKAYEERTAKDSSPNIDVVSKHSVGSMAVVSSTRKGSRKSGKSEGTSRVLQVWREEKRLRMAAAMSAAEEAEEVYTSRRKSRMSILNFLGPDIKNPFGSIGNGEEVEDEHVKPIKHKKRMSTTKKTKKADKKKIREKDADQVSLKQVELLRKAAPPIGAISDQSGALMISNSDLKVFRPVPSSSVNDSNMCVTISQFFRSHSSSITDLPKPPAEEKQQERNRIFRKMKSSRHTISKKHATRTK